MNRMLTSLLTLVCLCSPLWGMGEEQLGNEPVNATAYESSPAGILSVINDTHRVYRWWVNGNEKFFYRGDTIALNAALQNFAKIDSDTLEVVLRPGPAVAATFAGDNKIPYNWHLHLIGGIAASMSKNDLGKNIWPAHPIMYVYIGGAIQLSDLEIPDNVSVLQLSDLKTRYAAALKSTNQTVRGWACGELAAVDQYDSESMKAIAKMLQDDACWVRLNAAGALETYGGKAKAVVRELEAASQTDDESLKKRIEETMQKIASAKSDIDREEQHNKMLAAISSFCAAREAKEPDCGRSS